MIWQPFAFYILPFSVNPSKSPFHPTIRKLLILKLTSSFFFFMKIRTTLQLFLYAGAALLLAGCADEDSLRAGSGTLSGEGKTPLVIEATLGTGNTLTRAEGKKLETGDELLAYLRHTTGPKAGSPLAYPTTTADQAPRLVKFTMTADAEAATGTVTETSAFDVSYTGTGSIGAVTELYWDDFSDSRSADTDLRTSDHGLQSYYGYCYNGGIPSTLLDSETGLLGWTVGTVVSPATAVDQNSATAIKHADLLWSKEQETVEYAHASAHGGEHGTLTIPYAHAMSQLTVTVTAAGGYDALSNPLTNTTLTLNNMNTKTTLTAPTGTFSPAVATAATDGSNASLRASVTMCANSYASGGLTRNYTAIVAPGTKLKEGEKLLDIKDVDDNNYTVTITANMLNATAWGNTKDNTVTVVSGTEGAGTESDPTRTYIVTQPGVNYHLTVTIKKTEIQTRATLADWQTVNASGIGDVVYDDDETDETLVMDDSETPGRTSVHVVAVDENLFDNGASFSLFQLLANSSSDEANERTNAAYDFATVSTFQNRDYTTTEELKDEWTNSPEIFWPNKTDNYYFRALAKFNSATAGVNSITSVGTYNSDKGVAVSQGTVAAGHDILWGTTAKHKGKATTTYPNGRIYDRGQAIPPRTGDVPIAFEHAMSKVTFILETSGAEDDTATPEYAPVNDNNSKVDLRKASIAISNLATEGTITIENGVININEPVTTASAITGSATSQDLVKSLRVIDQYIVIPQTIGNDAFITITLKDQSDNVTATYKLQLNTCKDTSDSAIDTWQRGKHYIYTIHVEKEQITFRALIKDWEVSYGSGNANLEWD